MKEAIRKFIKWLVNIINLPSIIDEVREKRKLVIINNLLVNNGAFFYPETKIENPQNRLKISIGKGSHVRGQLVLYKYDGEITIGSNCYVGENSRIWSAELINIGNNVLISHNVNIMDTNSHEINADERASRYKELVEKGPWPVKGNVITAPIIIHDNVWINFNSVILKGITVGEGAIIAAGSVVTKDVASYTLVAGNPAKFIKTL